MLRVMTTIVYNQYRLLLESHTSTISFDKRCIIWNSVIALIQNKPHPPFNTIQTPTSHSNKHAKLQCRFLNQLLQRFLMISHAFQVQISIRPIPLDRHDLQRPSEVLSVKPRQRQSISQSAHRRIHLPSHAHPSLTPKSVPSFSNAFTVDVV